MKPTIVRCPDQLLSIGTDDPGHQWLGQDLGALAEAEDALRQHLDECRRRSRKREEVVKVGQECRQLISPEAVVDPAVRALARRLRCLDSLGW